MVKIFNNNINGFTLKDLVVERLTATTNQLQNISAKKTVLGGRNTHSIEFKKNVSAVHRSVRSLVWTKWAKQAYLVPFS